MDLATLVRHARGDAPAHLLLRHARLVNVFSGEIEETDVAVFNTRIVGLGNLGRVRGRNEGEVAVIVSDDYQGHGLGTELMRRLVEVARAEKMTRVIGSTMWVEATLCPRWIRMNFNVPSTAWSWGT